MCADLQRPDSSTDSQLAFANRVSSTLFGGQWGVYDGLRFNCASSEDANNDAVGETSSYPDGVHVDTNNECSFRSVTVILYLNDVQDGSGATVFPLARALETDPALAASRRLLEERIGHTRSCGAVRRAGAARADDAELLEARVSGGHGANDTTLRIQPKAGRLCIFFTRLDDGSIDPYSWHGGERLRQSQSSSDTSKPEAAVKRILTLFKEVYYGASTAPQSTETTFEAFLAPQVRAQRVALRAMAGMTSRSPSIGG
jgi:hypothetical protein